MYFRLALQGKAESLARMLGTLGQVLICEHDSILQL